MIGALLVTAFANDGFEKIENREDQIKERRTYFRENIKPKVDAKRDVLEKSLSQEDKKEIIRLREELISQRLMQNELFHDARAERIKGNEVNEDLLTELKAQRIVIENLHDKAKIIANKYRPEIDDLLDELKDERKEWSKEMRADGKDFKGPRTRFDRQGRPGRGNIEGMRHGMRGRDLGIVAFLLWDVNRG